MNLQSLSPFSRRRFLQAAGVGALTMGVPGTVAASVNASRGLGRGAADRSVIFVLLCGGPSHLDTWDLKPGAPDDIRGPYRPVATSVPGLRISELHTRMPAIAQHFSVINSMTHVGNIRGEYRDILTSVSRSATPGRCLGSSPQLQWNGEAGREPEQQRRHPACANT